MSETSRIRDLYREGGLSEVWRGIYDYIVRSKYPIWKVRQFVEVEPTMAVLEGVETPTVWVAYDSLRQYRRIKTLGGEEPVIRDLVERAGPDDVVWDVGANQGIVAAFAASTGAAVYAFEPGSARSVLDRTISQQRYYKIASYGWALGDADTHVAFEDVDGYDTCDHVDPTGATDDVRQVRGDTLVDAGDVDAPTIVKIDVEGYELRVLDGMRGLLERSPLSTIYLEVHRDKIASYGDSVDDLEERLGTAGFSIERIHQRRPDNEHWRCVREVDS